MATVWNTFDRAALEEITPFVKENKPSTHFEERFFYFPSSVEASSTGFACADFSCSAF